MRYSLETPSVRSAAEDAWGHCRHTLSRRFGDALLLQSRSPTARAVSPSVNPRQRRGHTHRCRCVADAPPLRHSCYTSDTARARRIGDCLKKDLPIKKKVVTLSARNRFALHGVRLKGNAVRIGDSTRCCDSRRTWATISHCKPSERLREGSPMGRDKSEDLPVSEKLHIDAFGS